MKAIRLNEPGHFELADVPDLSAGDVSAGQALVRVHSVGLCGTDIHAFHGRQPFFDYPRILGHELGVEIVAVGDGVNGLEPGMKCSVEPYLFKPGDRAHARGKTNCTSTTQCLGVHVDGGMQPYYRLPARLLHPSSLPTRALALVETLCIGNHAVERASLIGDETVAVVGMGPIGLGVLQFARLAGAKTVAIDISKERLEAARKMYPGLRILELNPDTGLTAAWENTDLEAPEVVWDCTGDKASMEASIALAGHGGKVVMVGLFKGELTFPDPDFHRRELSLLATRNATGRNFRSVIHLMESGLVDAEPWITHECKAEEFPDIVESWLAPGSGLLKGVIHFS